MQRTCVSVLYRGIQLYSAVHQEGIAYETNILPKDHVGGLWK